MAVPLRITVVPDGVAKAVEAATRARSGRRFIESGSPFFTKAGANRKIDRLP
jgi:hypothetical protein